MKFNRQIASLLIPVFLLLFGNCEKSENYQINNLNHNTIMILGHAGMGEFYKYPNNSWEAIEPVLRIGADGTEIDLQMTKDSVLILFHDETLHGRTKCGNYTSPYDYNWDEIKDCIYNTVFDEIPIYSLDDIFRSIPNLNEYYFSFDIKLNKDDFYDNEYRLCFLRAVKKICEEYEISRNVFIEGDLDLQLKSRELGMTTKGIVVGSSVKEAVENEIFGIGLTIDASDDQVKKAHAEGLFVMIWGAKSDAGNKKGIKLNPDFLQTDKPIPALMLFNRFNYDYSIP